MGAPRSCRAAVVAGLAVLAAGCVEPGHVERRFTTMGTYAEIDVHATSAAAAEDIARRIESGIEGVDAAMSNWSDASDLAALNRGAAQGAYVVPNRELWRCVKLSLEYARRTLGAYDPTVGPLMRLWGFRPRDPRVPTDAEIAATLRSVGWEKVELIPEAHALLFREPGMEIDLGGIAKGYALDVAARSFAAPGARAGLVDLGGSLYAWGTPPGAESWKVGLRDPADPDRLFATLPLRDRAVATAGSYENAFVRDGVTYGHVMDPKTGRPASSDVVAATVLSDSGTEADALSTAFFVAGSRRTGEILERSVRVEAVLVVQGEHGPTVLASGSLRGRLELDPAWSARLGRPVRFILPPSTLGQHLRRP